MIDNKSNLPFSLGELQSNLFKLALLSAMQQENFLFLCRDLTWVVSIRDIGRVTAQITDLSGSFFATSSALVQIVTSRPKHYPQDPGFQPHPMFLHH